MFIPRVVAAAFPMLKCSLISGVVRVYGAFWDPQQPLAVGQIHIFELTWCATALRTLPDCTMSTLHGWMLFISHPHSLSVLSLRSLFLLRSVLKTHWLNNGRFDFIFHLLFWKYTASLKWVVAPESPDFNRLKMQLRCCSCLIPCEDLRSSVPAPLVLSSRGRRSF